MSDTSILDLIMDQTRDWLEQKLKTEVPEDDKSRVNLIKVGNLQDDPTVNGTNIMIHEASKTDPHELHGHEHYLFAPTFSLPNGLYWVRKFYLEHNHFFEGEDIRDQARRQANTILSRAEKALLEMPMGYTDDFGETTVMCIPARSFWKEQGGEGMFIWKGETHFFVLTEKT